MQFTFDTNLILVMLATFYSFIFIFILWFDSGAFFLIFLSSGSSMTYELHASIFISISNFGANKFIYNKKCGRIFTEKKFEAVFSRYINQRAETVS